MHCMTVEVHIDAPTYQEACAQVRAAIAAENGRVEAITIHPCYHDAEGRVILSRYAPMLQGSA